MRYKLYMSNYSQELYDNLKDNYYFASIIKKRNTIYEKDNFIYNNIKHIITDDIYIYSYSSINVRITFTCSVYYNKINMNFIFYIYKKREYENTYIAYNFNSYMLNKTIYNVRLSDIVITLQRYIETFYFLLPIQYDLLNTSSIHNKCIKIINNEKNKIKRLTKKFNINNDCIEHILSFMI